MVKKDQDFCCQWYFRNLSILLEWLTYQWTRIDLMKSRDVDTILKDVMRAYMNLELSGIGNEEVLKVNKSNGDQGVDEDLKPEPSRKASGQ